MRKIKMEVDVPENLLGDLMDAAFDSNYGGCWHWAEPASSDWIKTDESDTFLSAHIQVKEDGVPGRAYTVTHDTLVKGMQHILDGKHGDNEHTRKLKESIAAAIIEDDGGMLDSIDVDGIVQFGLFEQMEH